MTCVQAVGANWRSQKRKFFLNIEMRFRNLPHGQPKTKVSSRMPKPILKTSLGQLFEGDCLNVLPTFDSESADLIFADPPFNLSKEYASKMDDNIPDAEYVTWCKNWVDECIRVLKPGGSMFLYNLPKWNLLLGAHVAERLTFRHWIAVDIKYSLPVPGRLYPSHYSLLYFVKGKKPTIFHPDRLPIPCCKQCGKEQRDYGGYKDKMNPAGVNLADVWADIPPVRHSKYKKREANELSLKLMDRVLSMASDPGSMVMDPFGGAGTTFVAAELLGRRWMGSELHCQDIVSRFENLDDDAEHLSRIQAAKNTLFAQETIELRERLGNPLSDKYRIAGRKPRQPELNLD